MPQRPDTIGPLKIPLIPPGSVPTPPHIIDRINSERKRKRDGDEQPHAEIGDIPPERRIPERKDENERYWSR